MTDTRQAGAARAYPFSDPDRLDLDPLYAQLRREEPVTRVRLPFGEEAWLATRLQDVKTVLGDLRFSRAAAVGRDEPRTTPRQIGTGILSMDPPDHSRLRRLVAKAFTARRVEQLRPGTTDIANELIDAMVAAGPPADLVEAFSTPLPVRVICRLLGVPPEDQHLFRTWSEAIVSTTSLTPERIGEYMASLHAYMAGLIAQRRTTPTDDLIGALVLARDNEDRLSEQEMVELAAGLLAAGHETTVTQISNFMYVLLTHPAKLAELRQDPERIPGAVEELLRYVPLGAAAAFARYATEDLELGGVRIRAGEPVIPALSAANRDASVFGEADDLDFTREANPHVGFGHGVHHCLGAQLARMELQVALRTLLGRLPELRLAVDEKDLPWKTGLLVRGLRELPVVW
ncbi:cytochrome P450 [Nucisporomicrobium flavum]|jgi:cytochrome P450|uniref:cytochrome P450 n=1 Tax=Nucisporomicrobium flavum TaxID=2785915 RepID=UPI0018F690DD|nr:cytochrome P450 [Nucisporomicrobium flavum]